MSLIDKKERAVRAGVDMGQGADQRRVGRRIAARAGSLLATAAALGVIAFAASALPATARLAPALAPGAADAYCSDFAGQFPQLTGYLSTSGGAQLSSSKTGDVYVRVSSVQTNWALTGCSAYRYSALAWNRSASGVSLGVDWGLLSGDGNACRYTTPDYFHATTGACPAATTARFIPHLDLEGVYRNNTSFNTKLDFAFYHSDCSTRYAAEVWKTGVSTSTGTGLPGANCSAKQIDNTATTQVLTVDWTPPTTATAGLPGYSTSRTVNLAWTATDNLSGIGSVHVDYATAAAGPYTVCNSLTTSATSGTLACAVPADGTYYFATGASDGNTNPTPAATAAQATTIVDTAAPPVPSITSPASTFYTSATSGTVTWGAVTDATSGLARYEVNYHWATLSGGSCVNQAADSGWGSVGLATSWGPVWGGNTCFAFQVRAVDAAGNSAVSAWSPWIIADQAVPSVSSSLDIGSATFSTAGSVTSSWSSADGGSGLNSAAHYYRTYPSADGNGNCTGSISGWVYISGASSGSNALAPSDGLCYQWATDANDRAGNHTYQTAGEGAGPTQWVMVDRTAPTGSIAINAGAAYASSTAVSLGLTKSDNASGVSQMRFNDGTTWSAWEPYAATKAWTLTSGDGTKTVSAQLQDRAGNTSTTISASIILDTAGPTGSIGAPAASQPVGGSVTISGTATDAGSFKDYFLDYGAGDAPTSWTRIATSTSPITSGTLATWASAGLTGAYTLRLTVEDNFGNPPAVDSRLLYLENTGQGDESSRTRVPFDLGGGLGAGVGVANGELTLGRDLFGIPSFGPAAELGLRYSSSETATAGHFGTGWTSNLTQYLTLESGFVVWHRADGGRVPFGQVGGVWTPLAGHFETLTAGTGTYTITTKDQTRLTFESSGAGRLTTIENRFGTALTLGWTTSTLTVTDASARATTLSLDASGQVTGATDSAGRSWTFAYSGTDLTSLTDPAGKVTTLAYDGSHRLTEISRQRTPATGPAETVAWTVAYTGGKVTGVTDPIGAATAGTPAHTFTYNAGSTVVGLLKTYSPVARNTTTYTLDGFGRPTAILDPAGYTTSQVFDPSSLPTSITRPITLSSSATTTYEYDTRGNVLSETAPIDATTTVTTVMSYNATNDLLTRSEADDAAAVKLVTLYAYDAAGHLTSVVANCTTSGTTPPADASTCTAAGTHDATTNLTTSYTYTANDQLGTETDPLGHVTRHLYDADGNETSVTRNYISGATPSADVNVTTSRLYLATEPAGKAGLVTSETDPVGATTTYTYDALGRQTQEVLPGDGSIASFQTDHVFDELGNEVQTLERWPAGAVDPPNRTTTMVYDLLNRSTSATDPMGVVSTTAYDAAGDATSSTSGGVTTTRVFDGLGQMSSETAGATTAVHTYDGGGRELTTVTGGATTTRVFDLAGHLLSETVDAGAPNGAIITNHTYDDLGREVTTTDPNEVVTTTSFDRVGRVTRSIVGGTTTETTYDRNGNRTAVTGPYPTGSQAGAVVNTTAYDGLDRPSVAVANSIAGSSDPAANLTTTTYYDAAGRTLATKDPKGVVARTFHNVRALATKTVANCTNTGEGSTPPTDPATCDGGGTADATTNVAATMSYDGSGALTSTTKVATSGNVTTVRTYDDAGRLTRVVVDQGTGRLNLTTEYAYDAGGRQAAVKDPRGTISRTSYDSSGRVARTIVNCTDSGTTIPTSWASCAGTGTANASWNVTTQYVYDARGNKTSEIAANGRQTTYTYDTADRLKTQTENAVAPQTAPDQNLTTTFYYDDAGQQLAVKAPTADRSTLTVTRRFYDALGRLTSEIRNCTNTNEGTALPANPATCDGGGTANASTNVATSYTFDAHGNTLSMTAPDPSAAASGTGTTVTSYAYDGSDRLCRVLANASVDLQTLADPCTTAVAGTATTNVSTRYGYDKAGNLTTMIDARGNTTTYAYDAGGRMTALTDPDGGTVAWTYDVRGNRLSQTNRNGSLITWTYDSADRVLTRLADGVTVTYGHDDAGNQTSAADGTRTISALFDRLNRPTSVTDSSDPAASTSTTYDFTSPTWTDPSGTYAASLDAFGREVSLADPIHGAGHTVTTYRADGALASLAEPNGNATTTAYDPLGRPIAKTTLAADGITVRAAYAWTQNRAGSWLTESSTVTGDPSNGAVSYAYDPLGRLTGYDRAGATPETYGWAAVPNRTSVTVGTAPTVTTSFDAANRPTSDSSGATYANTPDGQLSARPGQTLEWDSLGRLVRVRRSGDNAVLASYAYDPLDRLVSVSHPADGVGFRYVGLTASVAQLLDGTGAVAWNVANGWAGEHRFDWSGGGVAQRFYGTNGHHDVTWTAGPDGSVTGSLRYDPWGTVVASTGGPPPDFRYQGSWADPATDLVWMVTRWYAPSLGRFISEDSLLGTPADPASRALYAYGEGDPVGRWDPDGRASISNCGGLGCTAAPDGAKRLRQFTAFFTRFPGYRYSVGCYGGWWDACRAMPLARQGHGHGMVKFMDWLVTSRRLDRSRWWNTANREIVQGALTAWFLTDSAVRRPTMGSSTAPWFRYARSKYLNGPNDEAGYHGGTLRQAWIAHQKSLWNGVAKAAKYYADEPPAERLVIFKVLVNVNFYFEQQLSLDGLLGPATWFAAYPDRYPASPREACNMNYVMALPFTPERPEFERALCR